ncbi:MAG: DUF2200 family protein [Prevotella sp.]
MSFGTPHNWNPDRLLIKRTVCGVRVENIAEPLMHEIRYLDKLIDELAKGKSMNKILRNSCPNPNTRPLQKTLHVLQCQLVVPLVAYLPVVNEPVDMLARVVREAQVIVPLHKIIHDHSATPVTNIHTIQLAHIFEDKFRTELHHYWVCDILAL